MDVTHNPISACLGIFYKPNKVFAKLNTTANWSWIPFILVTFFTLYPLVAYLEFVDFTWYMDTMVTQTMPNASPAELENAKALMSKTTIISGIAITSFVMLLVFNLIFAAYLHFVTRSDEQNLHGFTDWFGFMWWVNLPAVFNFMGITLVLWFSEDRQIALEVLNPLSLAFWLDFADDSKWLPIAVQLRLEVLFVIYLTAVGISQFTHFNARKSWIVACIPFAAIFVLVTFLALGV